MQSIRLGSRITGMLTALLLVGACATPGGEGIALRMTGAEEVPPVATDASGTGTVRVGADRTVRGSFTTRGGPFTAAHIHEGAAGQNGPVVIPLQKKSESEWVVPPGSTLTDSQYDAYKAGRLYVNFHSAKHKGGEIRAQIRPGAASGGSRY